MINAIGEWWRARVPGLVVGALVGVLAGSWSAAAWVFAWQSDGESWQYYRVSPLGLLDPRTIVWGCAARIIGVTFLCALLGLLWRSTDRVSLVSLSLCSLRHRVGRALCRALHPRSPSTDR